MSRYRNILGSLGRRMIDVRQFSDLGDSYGREGYEDNGDVEVG